MLDLCYTLTMDSDQNIWRVWVGFLQRWGIRDLVTSILEAAGPFSVLGAQFIHIGQPLMNRSIPSNHLEALARLLEDENQKQAFIDFLDRASEANDEVSASHLALRRGGNGVLFVEARGRAFESDSAQPQKENRIRVVMMDVSALKFATDELQYSFQKFFRYWHP